MNGTRHLVMHNDMKRSHRTTLALVAATALLSACWTLTPDYERPAAPVAAAFSGINAADGKTGSAGLASDLAWQRFFGDPRLKRLIELALNNNRDLRIAVLNIERARAQYQVRQADQWPTVNAGITGSRQPSGNGKINSIYTGGLAVTSYELDLFGRVRSFSNSAQAQYLATEEARKTAQISLIASVASIYLNLAADDELLKLTQQTIATREDSFKLTKLKFDNGAASELDFRQAESLLEGARVTLAQLLRQRALDENLLLLLVGQPLPADLPDGLMIADQQLPDLPVGLPSDVLVRRPDVREAEQQLIAANANIGAARAALFPNIMLTGSVGSASTELSGLFKDASYAWTFAPQMLLTVFDAGRTRANLDVAKVDRDIAVAQYEKAIQSAFREVSDGLAGRATLAEQLRAQLAQANAESIRFKLADLRYRNGAASYLDVLDAQRSQFAAEQAAVQAQAAQLQNLVTLYKVLGGGWKASSAAN